MSDVKETQEQQKVEIAVQNFGPITEANIDLRPLTVFVGPSNTGKTYLATLIYVLHGIFNGLSDEGFISPLDSGKVGYILNELLKNTNVSDEEIRNILDKLDESDHSLKLSDLPKEMQDNFRTIVNDANLFDDEIQSELRNCFDINTVSELIRKDEVKKRKLTVQLRTCKNNKEIWKTTIDLTPTNFGTNMVTGDDIVIVPKGWQFYPSGSVDEVERYLTLRRSWLERKRFFLPAARSGIIQSYRILTSALTSRMTRVGIEDVMDIPTLSGVIAAFIQEIILYDDDRQSKIQKHYHYPKNGRSREYVQKIAESLESDVLFGQIHANSTKNGFPDFRYIAMDTNEGIRFSQSSSMITELAPLVLFLRGLVQPGDTLIIEEPEAHLHPGAQADIAVILARLVRAGVKVVITTHSDWLLQEIGNLILEGLLQDENAEDASWLLPEEVGVWHFQRDKPVEEIHFKHREGITPEDYQDVAEGLYNRSVNLQQKYEKQDNRSGCESE